MAKKLLEDFQEGLSEIAAALDLEGRISSELLAIANYDGQISFNRPKKLMHRALLPTPALLIPLFVSSCGNEMDVQKAQKHPSPPEMKRIVTVLQTEG